MGVNDQSIAVKNTRKVVSPRVMEESGCLRVGESSLCLSMTPPMLKVGWEFYQSYTSGNPWIVRFRPNFQAQANIQTQLTA